MIPLVTRRCTEFNREVENYGNIEALITVCSAVTVAADDDDDDDDDDEDDDD